jgi:hypothetical protein
VERRMPNAECRMDAAGKARLGEALMEMLKASALANAAQTMVFRAVLDAGDAPQGVQRRLAIAALRMRDGLAAMATALPDELIDEAAKAAGLVLVGREAARPGADALGAAMRAVEPDGITGVAELAVCARCDCVMAASKAVRCPKHGVRCIDCAADTGCLEGHAERGTRNAERPETAGRAA